MNYSEPPSRLKAMTRQERRLLSPRLLLAGAGILLVAGFFIFQGGFDGAPAAGGGQGGAFGRGNQAAPPVRVAQVETRNIPVVANTIGTVLANATVNVKSQIEGQLLSAHFREGQLVRRGDVLFTIDTRPSEAAVRQAEAQLARDRAQLESAESDAERAMALAERGIVSTQQRDQMIAQAKALSATAAANEAALERARLNLSYTTIRSPIDGKTGPLLVHPGNLVRANDANGMVTITQIQPVKISFALPQHNLPALQDRMREGALTASLRVHKEDALPGAVLDESELNVKVDFIGNAVDERTGTIELRATFENADMRLVPGELVDVAVQLNTMRNATVVPREAINIGQDGGTYVFLVNAENKALMRPIRVVYQDENIAVVTPGTLQAGERVITDGQLRVTPEVTVQIYDPNAPAGRGPGGGAAGTGAAARANGGAR